MTARGSVYGEPGESAQDPYEHHDHKVIPARPTHYAAATTGGLAFKCFYRELRAHIESAYDAPSKGGTFTVQRHHLPRPKRHTDLRRVTCSECWYQIMAIARVALVGKQE